MGKLAESLGVVPASKPCRVASILNELDVEDRDALVAGCNKVRQVPAHERSSHRYPYTEMWLVRALRAEGFTLSKDSMSRHIRGECGCEFA